MRANLSRQSLQQPTLNNPALGASANKRKADESAESSFGQSGGLQSTNFFKRQQRAIGRQLQVDPQIQSTLSHLAKAAAASPAIAAAQAKPSIGVFFDCDGVIAANTENIVLDITVRRALELVKAQKPEAGLDLEKLGTELRGEFAGKNEKLRREVLQNKLGLNIPPDYSEAELAEINANLSRAVITPCAERNLRKLVFNGVLPFMVTSSKQMQVDIKRDAMNIRDIFPNERCVTSNHVTNPKPHPEPYQLAMAKAGVTPETSVAIEDSVTGMKSPTAANMGLRIGFDPSGKHAKDLTNAGAHVVHRNMNDVYKSIMKFKAEAEKKQAAKQISALASELSTADLIAPPLAEAAPKIIPRARAPQDRIAALA